NINSLGDLNQTDFLSIWNSQRYQQFRRQLNTDAQPYRCRYCFDCRYKDINKFEQQMIVVEPGPQ
ncbi:MAG: SPASM domain-containing protein, partial [bacterium]|nr:SPASM domain-containing protein [bacterium]